MDLVGRKLMDGGEAAYRLLDEIELNAEEARHNSPEIGGCRLERRGNSARDDRAFLVAPGA